MTEQRSDLAASMGAVAKALLGDPVKEQSRGNDWRYRRKGSLSIDIKKGTWYDYEAAAGGGVLDLIRKERSCSIGEALRWLEHIGEHVAPVQPVDDDPRRTSSLREAAMRIWRETRPLEGTIASMYLTGRGLSCDSADVRFHPNCPFGRDENDRPRYVPAMVALVRNPGDRIPMGIHRTELTIDGRKLDRKMLGPCHGGVVMLSNHDADTAVGVCEGIETGLAVIQLGGGPVWACLSAGSLSAFPMLGGVHRLTIFADNDKAGLESAQKLAHRWIGMGIETTIQAPKEKGTDFADALALYRNGEVA